MGSDSPTDSTANARHSEEFWTIFVNSTFYSPVKRRILKMIAALRRGLFSASKLPVSTSRRLMSEDAKKEMTVPRMVGSLAVIFTALLGTPMLLMATRERPTEGK